MFALSSLLPLSYCSLNHLRVNSRNDTFPLFIIYFLKPRALNCCTMIKIKKLTPTQYYFLISRLYSGFSNCYSFFLIGKEPSRYVAFSCHGSLIFFKLKPFLWFCFVFLDIDIFLKKYSKIFGRMSVFGFVWCYFMIRFRMCIVVRYAIEMMCLSQNVTSGSTCWFVSSLVILTLVTC